MTQTQQIPHNTNFKLVLAPSEVLSTVAAPVDLTNLPPKAYFDSFKQFTLKSRGVGLAAPQVGLPFRFFAFYNGNEMTIAINPVIVSVDAPLEPFTEGCLSIPGVKCEVYRPQLIVVRYFDEDGKDVILPLSSLSAVIFQHELDHLDGILFVQRVAERYIYKKPIEHRNVESCPIQEPSPA